MDPRTIGLQWITLGIYVKPWEFETGHINPRFLSVGYFESDIFDPGAWYPTYPNPAFEYVTLRDAYWGAKIVMSFTDEQIRAIVASAQMSNPKAEEYLIKTLIERRDKVGRYWFERMNPLDKFKIKRDDQNRVTLNFQDLAVEGNIANAEDTKYVYTFSYDRAGMHKQAYVDEPAIPISDHGNGFLDDIVADGDIKSEEDKIFSVKIRTQRKDKDLSKAVEVYFYYAGDYRKARIVGIAREE